MEQEKTVHDCTFSGDKWIYELTELSKSNYEMRAYLPGVKAGDYISTAKQNPYYEVTQIISQRDHAGTFINKELSKNSHVVIHVRQLSQLEFNKLLEPKTEP